MPRLLLNICLIVSACAPLVLLVADISRRYSPNHSLLDIGFVDAVLLIAALALPLVVLTRLGVDWRSRPEEY